MLIAIPSKGRPGDVITTKIINGASLFVPADEIDEYVKRGHSAVSVPKDKSGIVKTRNFILDYAKRNGIRWVLMVDDDIKYISYFENNKYNYIRKNNGLVLAMITNNFQITEELGAKLWGLGISGSLMSYYSGKPFSLTTVVLGSFMGIVENGQRFDERFTTKEDYDFSIESLRENRVIFTDKKHSYMAHHWKQPGGCTSYRTMAVEVEMQALLIKKWGSRIVKPQNRGGRDGLQPKRHWEVVVRPPIRGV